MKKIIALTLVLILAVGLFAGCKSSDKGSVYFLNFKPEADSAWQALAKTYTEKTGVTVKVVTAASGTYETTLTAEMAKKDAPHAVPVRQRDGSGHLEGLLPRA